MKAFRLISIIALIVSSHERLVATAETFTNKTFLCSRPLNFYLPLEHSINHALFASPLLPPPDEHNRITLTALSQFSRHGSSQGEYFMFDKKNTLSIGRGRDIDNRYLKFNETSSTALQGTVELKPEIETYGLMLHYYKNLEEVGLPRWEFGMRIPFMYTKIHSNVAFTGTASSHDSKTISDYFSGSAMWQTTATDGTTIVTLQRQLEFGKIKDTQSKYAVASLDFSLQYQALRSSSATFSITPHLLVPTSANPTAEYVFEPIFGTADHWGFAFSGAGSYALNENCCFLFDAQWSYLIPSVERRVLGIKDRSGNSLQWGQYMLVGKLGLPYVEPAANILAQDVTVSPGHALEFLTLLSYRKNNIFLEAGYDFFARTKEGVSRSTVFDETLYAFPGSDYASTILSLDGNGKTLTQGFTSANSNLTNTIQTLSSQGANSAAQGTILTSQLDTDAAKTPALFSNALIAAWGYHSENTRINFTWMGGISFEIPWNNAVVQRNSIWVKGNILF